MAKTVATKLKLYCGICLNTENTGSVCFCGTVAGVAVNLSIFKWRMGEPRRSLAFMSKQSGHTATHNSHTQLYVAKVIRTAYLGNLDNKPTI